MIQEAAKAGALQFWATVITVVGVSVAALKALTDLRENLRWKRANAAREFLTEIHKHERAATAVMMMDWCESEHEYQINKKESVKISYLQVLGALQKAQKECAGEEKEVERFIRDCFDWFFYYVGRIEHAIRIKLIKFEDVAPVFRPYAKIIKDNRETYLMFITSHDYDLAAMFWQRYEPRPSFWNRVRTKLRGSG
jgi:hypothetical protein